MADQTRVESVWMNVRVERELLDAVKDAAGRDDRSVSSYVRQTLRRSVASTTQTEAAVQGGGRIET